MGATRALRAFGALLAVSAALAAEPVEVEVEPEARAPSPPSSPPPSPGAPAREITVLHLMSDREVIDARAKHKKLMMMMHASYDPSASMAEPMFRSAAAAWPNTTFALVDLEGCPHAAKQMNAVVGEIPKYGLALEGITAPVRYSGGWSEKSLSAWLRAQASLAPSEVTSLAQVRSLAQGNEHGLVAIGMLTEAQRGRRLLETAARGAESSCSIAHGSAALAAELGVPVPSFVIASREPSAPWATLSETALTEKAVTAFLRFRAIPLLVEISDEKRAFSKPTRENPLKLQVLLVHTSGARGADYESDRAVVEVRRAAAKFTGRAVFIAYDFFGNDPDQFVSHNIYASELPAVLVIYNRGKFEEQTWRLPQFKSGPDHLIDAADVEELVDTAIAESKQEDLKAPDGWGSVPAPQGFRADRVAWRDEL